MALEYLFQRPVAVYDLQQNRMLIGTYSAPSPYPPRTTYIV
jgi:hypothetical protein